ncbi:MAG: hypothetical protein KGI37_10415 [Alphaproteobacteria bacterium]|nr:hypothetical protein [Alphaproteobacteria bacterium]
MSDATSRTRTAREQMIGAFFGVAALAAATLGTSHQTLAATHAAADIASAGSPATMTHMPPARPANNVVQGPFKHSPRPV